jgi:hypothetical protein
VEWASRAGTRRPRDLPGLYLIEVDQGHPDGVHQLDVARAGLEASSHALELHLEHAPRDVVLRGEVAEERPAPDTRGRRDVLDGGLLEPVRLEKVERDVLQLGLGGRSPAPWLSASVGLVARRHRR